MGPVYDLNGKLDEGDPVECEQSDFDLSSLTESINENVRHTLFEIFCNALIFVLALFVFLGDHNRGYCTVYDLCLSAYLYRFCVHFLKRFPF